jgi:hypothetical protein
MVLRTAKISHSRGKWNPAGTPHRKIVQGEKARVSAIAALVVRVSLLTTDACASRRITQILLLWRCGSSVTGITQERDRHHSYLPISRLSLRPQWPESSEHEPPFPNHPPRK